MLFGNETSLEQLSEACLAQRERKARGWRQTGVATLAVSVMFGLLLAVVLL